MHLADDPRPPRAGRTPRHARADFWPPAENFDHPAIAQAIAEVRSLAERAEEARRVAVEAGRAVERAEQEDVAAHALAIRDGRDRPRKKADAARKKLREAEEEAAALTTATEAAAHEAVAALEEHSPELAERVRREREEEVGRMLAALDDVGARATRLAETGAKLAYLTAEEIRPWRGAAGRTLPSPRMPRTADDPGFAPTLAAIRAAVEGMRPEPEAERASGVRKAEAMIAGGPIAMPEPVSNDKEAA